MLPTLPIRPRTISQGSLAATTEHEVDISVFVRNFDHRDRGDGQRGYLLDSRQACPALSQDIQRPSGVPRRSAFPWKAQRCLRNLDHVQLETFEHWPLLWPKSERLCDQPLHPGLSRSAAWYDPGVLCETSRPLFLLLPNRDRRRPSSNQPHLFRGIIDLDPHGNPLGEPHP